MISRHRIQALVAIGVLVALLAPLLPIASTPGWAAPSEPSLRLSRSSARVGLTIGFSGTDFPNSAPGVLVLSPDQHVLAEGFETDQRGRVRGKFTVPDLPSGAYEIVLTAGDASASAILNVDAPRETATPPATATAPATSVPPTEVPAQVTAAPSPTREQPARATEEPVTAAEVANAPYAIVKNGGSSETTSRSRLYDGSLATPWYTTSAAPPSSANFWLDLGAIKPIGSIRWAFYKSDRADAFEIQTSNDRSTWTTIAVGTNAPAGQWQTFPAATSARYVRFVVRNPNNDPRIGYVSEFEIWAGQSSGTLGAQKPSANPTATAAPPTSTPTTAATATKTPVATATSSPTVKPTGTVPVTSTATSSATSAPASATAVAPKAVVLSPDADAYVVERYAAQNFGTEATLLADASPLQESHLTFPAIGTGGTVVRATLRLFVTDATSRPTYVYGTAGGWTEAGLTWNSRPARTTGAVATAASAPRNAWVEYDVTSLVQSGGAVSLVVVNPSADGVDFSSRTGTRPPQLVVETAGGSPPAATATPAPSAVSVAITNPRSGTTYTSDQVVILDVTVTGSTTIKRVEFYDNNVLAGTEDTLPFGYSWAITSAQNGNHRWHVKAFDAAGKEYVSSAIDLVVNIAATATPTGSAPKGPITAAAETKPVPHSGDAADDPAIWLHPSNLGSSTVIGTDKLGGLAVYDLAGNQLHYYADSSPNNVDLRYNFPLGGQRVSVVATSDRTADSIRLYTVNPSTRGLTYVSARTISTGIGVAGLCMYVSPTSGLYYVFIGDSSGTVQQWELFDNGSGKIDAKKVRTLSVGSTTEGCVADDGTGALYIAEEDVAIWRYGAEPGTGSSRSRVASVGGNLSADIEGLAIYYGGSGYLIASSQGSNDFAVFSRGSNTYLGRFRVEDGDIDGVSYTDGLDVTNVNLGGAFSSGLFVAQDDRNPGGNQNFKLVPWDRIAASFTPALDVSTGYDPRGVAGGGSPAPAPTQTPVGPTATPVATSTPTPAASATPPSGGSGTTYYVDSTAGNDANNGTSTATPWKSLSKASTAALNPGDRILFKRGGAWTGKLTVSRSGTASNPIVVSAYGSGNMPVIQGGSSCVSLSGSYVVVQALTISACGWSGVEITGNNNRIEGNTITGNVAGIYVKSGASANRIISNQILDNNRMSVNTPGGSDDSGAFGVLIHGDGTEVAYNVINGHDAFSYDYGRDGAAIEIYGGQRNHIHHNTAAQNDAFTELGNSRAADNTFAYNVVTSSLAESVFLVTRGSSSSYGPVARTSAFNNTVLFTGANSQGFVCHAGCGPTVLSMRNNIIVAVWKVGYADRAFDEDNNLYSGGQAQFVMGGNSRIADPRFVDAANGNLRLQSSSPAIDRGVSVGYDTDRDGNPVPIDGNNDGQAAPDIGAYEYR